MHVSKWLRINLDTYEPSYLFQNVSVADQFCGCDRKLLGNFDGYGEKLGRTLKKLAVHISSQQYLHYRT